MHLFVARVRACCSARYIQVQCTLAWRGLGSVAAGRVAYTSTVNVQSLMDRNKPIWQSPVSFATAVIALVIPVQCMHVMRPLTTA